MGATASGSGAGGGIREECGKGGCRSRGLMVTSEGGFFFAGLGWLRPDTAAGVGHDSALLAVPPPDGAIRLLLGPSTQDVTSGGALRNCQTPGLLHSEVQLDPAKAAALQHLAVGQQETLEVVGYAGEEAAVHGLEGLGFEVAWVNRLQETAWPFDLVLRKAVSPGVKGRLSELFRCPEAEAVEQDRKTLEELLESDPETVVVEVKANFAEDQGLFSISTAQVALARQLGPRFWLVKVQNLRGTVASINVLQGLQMALQEGLIRLVLVA